MKWKATYNLSAHAKSITTRSSTRRGAGVVLLCEAIVRLCCCCCFFLNQHLFRLRRLMISHAHVLVGFATMTRSFLARTERRNRATTTVLVHEERKEGRRHSRGSSARVSEQHWIVWRDALCRMARGNSTIIPPQLARDRLTQHWPVWISVRLTIKFASGRLTWFRVVFRPQTRQGGC